MTSTDISHVRMHCSHRQLLCSSFVQSPYHNLKEPPGPPKGRCALAGMILFPIARLGHLLQSDDPFPPQSKAVCLQVVTSLSRAFISSTFNSSHQPHGSVPIQRRNNALWILQILTPACVANIHQHVPFLHINMTIAQWPFRATWRHFGWPRIMWRIFQNMYLTLFANMNVYRPLRSFKISRGGCTVLDGSIYLGQKRKVNKQAVLGITPSPRAGDTKPGISRKLSVW